MYYRILDHVEPLLRQDGLPRVVRSVDQDGVAVSQVAYLENEAFRTMLASAWLAARGPLPSAPTQPQIDAAIAARLAAAQLRASKRAAVHGRARAGLAVGVDMDALTTPQLLQLVKAMGDALGAFDDDGFLLPPAQWGQ